MYRADMLHSIIHSYCIKKRTLKIKRNLKKSTPIQSHILRILPTSTLHGPFVRYWNSEFSLSLESLCNSLWLQYSEFPPDLASIKLKFQSQEIMSFGQIEIFSNHRQLSETITPELLVWLWHLSNRQKVEMLATILVLKVPRYYIRFGVKSTYFAGYPILFRTEFQHPCWLQKVITSKPFIIPRCANNHWKERKILYNYRIGLLVRSWKCI
jgi:hypothetical protein